MEGLFVFLVLSAVALAQTLPTGVILPYAAAAAPPAGFLLCDGTSYDQTTYATLFSVIGITYGGNATTFSVPNLQGRVPVGRKANGGGGSFASAVGSLVGSETHILSVKELAAHTHSGVTGVPSESLAHDHDSGIMTDNGGALPATGEVVYTIGSVDRYRHATSRDAYRSGLSPDLKHTHEFVTATTGTGTPFSVIQPSIVMSYIIKT